MGLGLVNSLLVLALLGAYGCVPAALRSLGGHQAAMPQTTALPDPDAASPSTDSSVLSPALLALMAQQDQQEEVSFAPLTPDVSKLELFQNEIAKEKPAKEKPAAKTREQASGAPRKVPEPDADDRLVSLVEKDLNKAVEQPPEYRRLQFSKAVINHPKVRYFLRQFSRTQKDYFGKALARSGKYFPMIAKVLREEGLPEELVYLALIESNFFPDASSRRGAVGLWQFVPETARRYGLKIDAWLDERRDPVKSTRAAAAYLKDLHQYFGRWYLATAAYNAGEGTIERALQSSGAKDFWNISTKASLRNETRNFVPKFVAASLIATDPRKYGFNDLSYDPPLDYEEVEVGGNLSLAGLAEMAGTDVETMRSLNLELVRNRTPPGETTRLKLPARQASLFALAYQQKQESEQVEIVTHEVKRGETLFSIARRYGQEVRSLMELNGLTNHRLRIGQKLKVIFESLRGKLR